MGGFGALARLLHVLGLAVCLGAVAFGLLLAPSELPALFGLSPPPPKMWQALSWAVFVSTPGLLLTLFVGWIPLQVSLRYRVGAIVALGALAFASVRWLGPMWLQATEALSRVPLELPPWDPQLLERQRLAQYVAAMAVVQGLLALYLVSTAMLAKKRRAFGGGIEL